MTAEYQVHGDVAVITLNNPPVNGLGLATRQGIVDALAMPEAAQEIEFKPPRTRIHMQVADLS